MKRCLDLQRTILNTITRIHLVLLCVLGMFALPVLGQQISINSGAYFNNIGTSTIEINNGNFVNNGSYTKGNETLIFSGNTAKTISGSSNTEVYNLSISNTGGITTQLNLLTTNNLTVASGSMFSIDPAKSVTVIGILTNSDGNTGFVLKSDAYGTASLIHNSNNVSATVERYISGTAEAWHFLSSPVAAQGITGSWLPTGTYGNGTGYDLYAWNEPTNCWIYKLNTTSVVDWDSVHPGANFGIGRGYLYSVQATNPTREFAGDLNNGTLTTGITFSGTVDSIKGFNLVGNPYPSSIDWQAALGWTRSDLVNSGGGYDIWIWNPTANNYGVFNSFTGAGTNSATRYIAPVQGFFVRAASTGNLGITNSVRAHNNGSWFKNTEITPAMLSIKVKPEIGNGSDEALLLFGYTANQPGALKLFSQVATAPSLYLLSGNKNYSVQYLTNTADNPAVPVLFKAGSDGNYMLSCSFDLGSFETVMLEDRSMQNLQDMKERQTYSFEASTYDAANRFVLHFGGEKKTLNSELPASIYTAGSRLVIDLTLVSTETGAYIYDVLGRLLLEKTLTGSAQHNLGINCPPQILLVLLKNQQGGICSKVFYPNTY